MVVDLMLLNVCKFSTVLLYFVVFTIFILLLDGYGPSGRRDFDNTTRTIVFKAGSRNGASISVNIPVIDDDIQETQEGFIILLDVNESHTSRSQVALNLDQRTALGRIFDNDRKHSVIIITQISLSSPCSFLFWIHSRGVYI